MYREEIEFAAKYFRRKLSDSDALTGEIDQIFLKNRIILILKALFYTIYRQQYHPQLVNKKPQ